MNSLILTTATRFLMPLLLMFSIFLLFRGHDAPGGGFAGGLVAAGAFALYAITEGVQSARELLRADPRFLALTGLGLALVSGIIGLMLKRPFLSGIWAEGRFQGSGALGTPLLFDIGVYLLVVGVALTVLFSLAEEQHWRS